MAQRPTWNQYFMKMAELVSERATCPRKHCGTVLVRDNFVLATGYNGSLPGQPHCDDVGCDMVNKHCVRTNHSEMNALCQAALHGVSVKGATAYINRNPCSTCAKALIAAGIVKVVIGENYGRQAGRQVCVNAGIPVHDVEETVEKIPEEGDIRTIKGISYLAKKAVCQNTCEDCVADNNGSSDKRDLCDKLGNCTVYDIIWVEA